MPDMPGDKPPTEESAEATESTGAERPQGTKPKRKRAAKGPWDGQRKRESMPKRRGKPRAKNRVSDDEIAFGKVSKKILDGIRMGLAEYVAAHAANVSPRNHRRWKLAGREATAKADKGETLTPYEQRLADYFEACIHGAAVTEHRCVSAIQTAIEAVAQIQLADGVTARDLIEATKLSAQAAQWMVTHDRRFNDRWGTKQRTEVTGKDGGPLKTESTTKFTLADVDAMLTTIQKNVADDDSGEPQ